MYNSKSAPAVVGSDGQLDFNTKTSVALQPGKQGTGQGQMCVHAVGSPIRMDRCRWPVPGVGVMVAARQARA